MTACFVVRDDLFPGGTKARFLPILFEGANEVVYASPAEGGAQTALATVAAQLGKRATIFVARRAHLHPRTLMAKRLGARAVQVSPGYLECLLRRVHASTAKKTAALRQRLSAWICREPCKLLLKRHVPSEKSPTECGVLLVRVSWRAV